MRYTEKKTLYLPFELIIEILLRLPVKSLICFKCVYKSWFSLISNPNFANSHFQLTATSRILSISSYETPKFQSIDFEINRDFVLLMHPNFFLPRSNSYFYYNYFQIKGSCRGFICLYGVVNILIWNPSSRIQKQIPLSPFASRLHEYNLYGFGYDLSRDDYLVVLLSYDPITKLSSHLEFFSLRDNTWNEIGVIRYTYLKTLYVIPRIGSFVNGVVHWLAKLYDSSVIVIVAFDLMERKLFEMPIPYDLRRHDREMDLWVFGEFLSLWDKHYCNHTIEIWVMKEYNLHSSWTKTLVIRADCGILTPIYRTKSGDIIGRNNDSLVKYNDKGQLLEYLDIDRHAEELAMYTESLFSLSELDKLVLIF